MNTQTTRHFSLRLLGRTVTGLAAATLLFSASAIAAEDESTMARGGMLYDKWYKVIGADKPTQDHPLYPTDKAYFGKADANWRCKECHGWDTLGKDGAYASGKHFSGIPGVQAYAGKSPASVVAVLMGPSHGYGDKLSSDDLNALGLFVTKGTVDMNQYIDSNKKPIGNAAKGEAYYNTVCAKCHGTDGLLPDDMPPLGSLMGNPWEVMHKILNGQPDEAMPALRAFDHQIAADIMVHMTTLPSKR